MCWLLKDQQEFTSPGGDNLNQYRNKVTRTIFRGRCLKDEGEHEGLVRPGKRR